MTTPPLVTVGVTCFNSEETISRAILSALNQSWENLEVIVVDDCSTDSSWDKVKQFIEIDSRVKGIQHKTNQGAASARNTIIKEAKGDYIAFFDDDDESLPERIKIQYQVLNEFISEYAINEVACFASGVRRYSNGYDYVLQAIGSYPEIPHCELVTDYLLFNRRKSNVFYGSGTPTCSLMLSTRLCRRLGGFDENLRRVEDVDFAIRLSLTGGYFIGCKEPLFIQYATLGEDKTPEKNLESELSLIDKHQDYLKAKGRYRYSRQWFKIRYYHFSKKRVRFIFYLVFFLLNHPISGLRHLLHTVPSRISHEKKMRS